jgi:hypothetical protein
VAAQTGDVETKVASVEGTKAKLDAGDKVTGWPTVADNLGSQGEEIVRRVCGWLGIQPRAQQPRKQTPRVLEPYRPFRTDALPEPLRAYVVQAAQALGCDPAFLALPVLAVVASVIGNSRTARLKRGWDEPCVVWSAIIGDSGTLKSPAYLKAVGYLFRLQKQLLQDFRAQHDQYAEDLAAYRAAKRTASKAGDGPGAPPQAPAMRRVVCSDCTIEKLAEVLEDNPRGTLVARDELAGWLGSFTRYKGKQGGSDLPAWLEMHRAGTVVVDRKTGDRPTLYVPHAAVSVTGGIQPGVLARSLSADFLDAGLGARLLLAMPPQTAQAVVGNRSRPRGRAGVPRPARQAVGPGAGPRPGGRGDPVRAPPVPRRQGGMGRLLQLLGTRAGGGRGRTGRRV